MGRCTTAAACSTLRSWTSPTLTCWPSPRPPRSPSRRLRPSRPSWPTPAPLPQLLRLPLRLLLQLLPPHHRRRRAKRRTMTWASASSTNLCHPYDDCRSFVNFQCDCYRCNEELSSTSRYV